MSYHRQLAALGSNGFIDLGIQTQTESSIPRLRSVESGGSTTDFTAQLTTPTVTAFPSGATTSSCLTQEQAVNLAACLAGSTPPGVKPEDFKKICGIAAIAGYFERPLCADVKLPPIPTCLDDASALGREYCKQNPAFNGPNKGLNALCWLAKKRPTYYQKFLAAPTCKQLEYLAQVVAEQEAAEAAADVAAENEEVARTRRVRLQKSGSQIGGARAAEEQATAERIAAEDRADQAAAEVDAVKAQIGTGPNWRLWGGLAAAAAVAGVWYYKTRK